MQTRFRATKPALLAIAAIVPLVATGAEAALVISSGTTKNVTCSNNICTATARSAVLNVGDLQTMLASSSVTVATGTSTQSIHLESALTWVSSSTLTLSSQQQMKIDQPISVAGTGGLSLLATKRQASGSYLLSPSATITFWSTSDLLTINGRPYSLENNIAALANDINGHQGVGFYALANSYDASGDGTYAHSPIGTNFGGEFDGLGNTISNLSINGGNIAESNIALFANIVRRGVLRNVILSSVNIASAAQGFPVGALAGTSSGRILGSSVSSGTVTGSYEVDTGGLVGDNSGTIDACFAGDAVTNYSIYLAQSVGGLVAGNAGVIDDFSATGPATGNSWQGGLVGQNSQSGLIANSHATGSASGGGISGGLVGENGGWIYSSYATGSAGGGGLVGEATGGTIENTYATGAVSGGVGSSVGGLIGGAQSGAVASSYSTGTVVAGGGSLVGGFVGTDDTPGGITDAYWDTETSGKKRGTGNRGNEPGITGLTTAQFQSGLPAGFDPRIWGESANINGGLPYLLANPPQ